MCNFLYNIKDAIRAALRGDPALKRDGWSKYEVVMYQGVYAILLHRLANWLYINDVPFVPRLLSQLSRFFTGIEIHPGAQIGYGVFIDHGAGVVIGETAQIGNNVIIYHGVTLGGTSLKSGKRHPTIGSGVVIGAGASLFGSITIGDNCQIGGGAVVSKDVPQNCVVVGNPAHIVKREGIKVIDTVNTVQLPDPIMQDLLEMARRIHNLEESQNITSSEFSFEKVEKE